MIAEIEIFLHTSDFALISQGDHESSRAIEIPPPPPPSVLDHWNSRIETMPSETKIHRNLKLPESSFDEVSIGLVGVFLPLTNIRFSLESAPLLIINAIEARHSTWKFEQRIYVTNSIK